MNATIQQDYLRFKETMKTNLVTEIARTVDAYHRCIANNNTEWQAKHRTRLSELCDELPHGSGIDKGINLDIDASTGEKLVFNTSFHHMNDGGYYDGWTDHTVVVRPSLMFGFTVSIGGRNRNDIKDHLHEVIQTALAHDYETTL